MKNTKVILIDEVVDIATIISIGNVSTEFSYIKELSDKEIEYVSCHFLVKFIGGHEKFVKHHIVLNEEELLEYRKGKYDGNIYRDKTAQCVKECRAFKETLVKRWSESEYPLEIMTIVDLKEKA